ncbi:hypothetical protein ACHQM5_023183 [Ranunculus cassubicifolius]
MRSPFNTTQNHFSQPKTTTNHSTTTTTTTTFQTSHYNTATNRAQQFCYEPTSVLELRRSPSPILGGSDSINNFAAVSGVSDDSPLQWDDQVDIGVGLGLLPSNNNQLISEDWDSMMLGLTEKDDSTHLFKPNPIFEPTIPNRNLESFDPSSSPFLFQDFPQNQNFNMYNQENNEISEEFDCSQLDQLIRAASMVESNDTPSAQVILARLNQQLQSPNGKPLQRSAFYFKEALQFFLSGSNFAELRLSPLEMVHKIKSYKSFSEISPITMFANFTANQTLLEGLDGALFIHIIDFEIGIGGQWASFMQEISTKAKSRNLLPCSVRITAVIPEEATMEAGLIRDNLHHFAQELGIQFQIDFVLFSTFEDLLFNSVRFINGESIAVNLSPKIFRHLRSSESISGFLRFLRRISPRITMFIDFEGCRDVRGNSFRRNFVNGLEFYSSMFESLDIASGGDVELVRRIEKLLLRPKIFATVTAAGNCLLPWKELFSSVGMMPVQFSEFTDSQAEWLVRRAQVRGFHVAKRQGSMLLCWHERELVATSAWRC